MAAPMAILLYSPRFRRLKNNKLQPERKHTLFGTIQLLAIRCPDILHLCCLAQKFLAFALFAAVPVARVTVVYPGALHVPCGKKFHLFAAFRCAEIPDSINIVVF